LIDRKKRLQNKDLVQRDEDTQNIVTVEGDIMERAKAANINPSSILEEITTAVKSIVSSKPDGICTNADVNIFHEHCKSLNKMISDPRLWLE
jgi:hypothetical protein